MRTKSLALIFLATLAVPGRTDDQIPLDVLNKIKAATVFVKVKTATGRGSGSGFVIQPERGKYFVVTNEHVVVHEEKRNAKTKPTSVPEIQVVFDSGTNREREYKAEIVVTDSVHDLALLRLDRKGWGVDNGIDYAANVKIAETMPVCMVGFPFGSAMAVNRRENPTVTIGRGHISSFREDKQGVRKIQIDGDINPGNSGGPVVDQKGRLVGVAVAKVLGTNIGFMVPADEIPNLVEPRIPKLTMQMDRSADNIVPVHCELELHNPTESITKVSLRYAPASGREPRRSKPLRGHSC